MSSNFSGENIGNPETKRAIYERGSNLLQTMWAHRKDDLVTLYRTCSEEEAWKTFTTMLAGGEFRLDMKQLAPSESQAVQQVGNNETWKPVGEDPRIAKLRELGIPVAQPKAREVVEYSLSKTQLKLSGVPIKIQVNINYVTKGSGLSNEGFGRIVQIGTPLASVWINPPQDF